MFEIKELGDYIYVSASSAKVGSGLTKL